MACRAWLLLLLACAGATPVPEPHGFWTGPAQAPVPDGIAGGEVIRTAALAPMLQTRPAQVVLVDVASAPKRPPSLAAGALWLPLPHRDIPGSAWIPDAGLGVIPDALDAFFRRTLREASHGDATMPVVVYCHHACWLSWNAAKRAISYGHKRVYWYPDGVEGWTQGGHDLAVAAARSP